MFIQRFDAYRLRVTRIAGCLAAALALSFEAASAAGPLAVVSSGASASLDHGRDSKAEPNAWRWRNPSESPLRWQPAAHALPAVPANSIIVHNCNDSGSGSLREALADAGSGDTIDLTQLSCSQITLTTGSILFDQATITLQGPGWKYLSIDGNDAYAPLLHAGNGALYINDLAIEHGKKYFTDAQIDDARGGCIFSSGSVVLSGSEVAYCTARSTTTAHDALGGAIYAYTGVSLSNSGVVGCAATSPSFGWGGGIYSRGYVDLADSFVGRNYASSFGGGVSAQNGLRVKYSTIDGNGAGYADGGAFGMGNITISNSTISNNGAGEQSGGAFLNGDGATIPLTVLSSTISGNRAHVTGGLSIATDAGQYARIANSTIAFNDESTTTKYGGGLGVDGTLDLESTIVANDTYGGGPAPDDVGGSNATISGANNLIGFSSVPVPGDTILMQYPLLGMLGLHGGTTATHMVLSGSPALDAGNDAANVSYDQRGGGFARVIGASADIGAYERDTHEAIFSNGFDR
jgi:hypothetical protein